MGAMRLGVAIAAAGWLAALSVYDVRERRLPNTLTLPGAAVVLALAAFAGRGGPAVAGAVALAGVYLVVYAAAPAALGGGDVKLALGLGALTGYFGIEVWTLAAIGAPLLTALWAVAAMVRRSARLVPHGPSMCLASAAAAALAAF
jgi:leader peptidase (prepilin peptidase) / N-methyltransferase